MKKIITGAILMTPMLAFAQAAGTPLEGTITTIGNIVNMLIPILLALAVLVFFWGLVKYIMSAEDEGAKEQGKTLMIWGMIALFVMVAFWGIIGYVQNTLGLSGTVTADAAPPIAPIPSATIP